MRSIINNDQFRIRIIYWVNTETNKILITKPFKLCYKKQCLTNLQTNNKTSEITYSNLLSLQLRAENPAYSGGFQQARYM